jgi:hypothetical protein
LVCYDDTISLEPIARRRKEDEQANSTQLYY